MKRREGLLSEYFGHTLSIHDERACQYQEEHNILIATAVLGVVVCTDTFDSMNPWTCWRHQEHTCALSTRHIEHDFQGTPIGAISLPDLLPFAIAINAHPDLSEQK